MIMVGSFISLLGIAVIIAQIVWIHHNSSRFNSYKLMWDAAHLEWESARQQWNEAHKRGDDEGMKAAFSKEEHAYRTERQAYGAEQRVHCDLLLPPWRWIRRWNHDYLVQGLR